jgi:hypothetical protein
MKFYLVFAAAVLWFVILRMFADFLFWLDDRRTARLRRSTDADLAPLQPARGQRNPGGNSHQRRLARRREARAAKLGNA